MSVELQQTPMYRTYIKKLGWHILEVDNVAIFYRNLPMIGVLGKIQRPHTLPYIPKLIMKLQEIGVRSLVLEPAQTTNQPEWIQWTTSLSKFFRIITTPYLPSKTILIDIQDDEQMIFKRFTEAKQRAVRKAIKNGIYIQRSDDIKDLISVKSSAAGLFGEITTYGLKELSDVFGTNNTASLLAYHTTSEHIDVKTTVAKAPNLSSRTQCRAKPVGGVFMIFLDHTAYYWIAGATKEGKKLFVPTLLVWESIQEAKRRGCTVFDFVGVWDERMPKQNTEWLGFTKFKEGFGGREVYYPVHNFMKR